MFTKLRHHFIRSRFKSRELGIIENIPLELANIILNMHFREGWELGREYDSPSSLQFKGKCIVQRGQSTLTFAYNEAYLGSIVGPSRIINAIAKQQNLVAMSSPTIR